jgi:GNAT superfamily N-acetyltransferase
MAVDDRRRRAARSLQVSAWRGDEHTVVLNPSPDRPAPTAAAIEAELARLEGAGHARALTGALHHHEVAPFLLAGFAIHEQLHLLRHDLDRLPVGNRHPLRRAWRRDRAGILVVDELAFDDFWTLDARGLDDAIRATPSARVRVLGGGPDVRAYAVTGRAGDRGYIQRLAVHPDEQRHGVGASLVADSLHWLARHGARMALVNTQERNVGALALYLACGFVQEPLGLTVLTRSLDPDPRAPDGAHIAPADHPDPDPGLS